MKKYALVTGARRGIGLGIARTLGTMGYYVVIAATAPSDEAILEELKQEGIEAEYLCCDISSRESREAVFREIEQRLGRLDLLVNNAGIAPPIRKDLLDLSEEEFDTVMDVNLRGTFFMCQLAAKLMQKMMKDGLDTYQPRIINISSVSAYAVSVNRAAYCISKAGISMTTQLFAERLAEQGIGVFEIRPGIIQTDMTAAVQEQYQLRIQEGLTPVRRMGKPEDVAACVAAIAGGYLDFAPGQVLNADGGFHIRSL